MIINAEFGKPHDVAPAISALKQLGLGGDRIEIFSARPLELEPGVLDRSSRMSFFAVAGAALFGSAVTAFMFYAQLDYPLVTGGMPLTSGWATGVISFESTMGGAIMATALMFLIEGGLLFRKASAPAPVVQGDQIVVQLNCSTEQADSVRTALSDAGASCLEVVGEPV